MTELTQLPGIQTENEQPARKGFGIADYALMITVVLVVIVIGFALARQNNAQPVDGRAPDFNFTTFDGQEMSLVDFRGEVVVLNFWASWCGPCIAEAPALQNTWEKYQGQGVQFVGIAYADNGPKSLEFLVDHGITYFNAPDLGTRISELYAIQGVPETFIIDQNGDVAEFIYAGVTEEQLTASIDRLLQEG